MKKKKSGLITLARGVKVKRGVEEKMREKPGSSSAGKYKHVKPKDFAGKSGGSSKFSFPINDIKHARNALARAHFAPNPEGIKRAVYKKFPELKKHKLEREGHKEHHSKHHKEHPEHEKIKAHMKRDIKEYHRMAEEDKDFMRHMKHKKHHSKHESHESKKHERAEKKAMQHKDVLGAGARKRKKLNPESKVKVVMKEFARGSLHSGSGEKVTNPKQALAIGYSEARRRRK